MDYTLCIARVGKAGERVEVQECSTMTDVCTYIASICRSQFAKDIDAGSVTFAVVDNTKTR